MKNNFDPKTVKGGVWGLKTINVKMEGGGGGATFSITLQFSYIYCVCVWEN